MRILASRSEADVLLGLRGIAVHGVILANLFNARSPADAPAEPFAQWYYLGLATSIFAQPAPFLRRQVMGDFIRGAMQACGAPLADSDAVNPAQAAPQPTGHDDAAQVLRVALIHAGFVASLSGDAVGAVRAMHDVAGQKWAAAHLCDLMWQSGVRRCHTEV